jgi:hypothetical protein
MTLPGRSIAKFLRQVREFGANQRELKPKFCYHAWPFGGACRGYGRQEFGGSVVLLNRCLTLIFQPDAEKEIHL